MEDTGRPMSIDLTQWHPEEITECPRCRTRTVVPVGWGTVRLCATCVEQRRGDGISVATERIDH